MTGGTAPVFDSEVLAARLARIRERIDAAGGNPEAITLVAVTKGQPAAAVTAALELGLAAVGENYANELLAKAAELGPTEGLPIQGAGGTGGPEWHFLGAPQRNKMGRLAPLVDLWQGVDRPQVIDRLALLHPGSSLLLQVNLVGDPGKGGCRPEDLGGLAARARDRGLDLQGLMCVGPAGDPQGTKACFGQLREMSDALSLPVVSMGMSDDFEIAVAAGSTMLRLGRVLFGPRPAKPQEAEK